MVVVTERVVGMVMDILRLAVAEAVVEDNVAALAAPWAAMERPVMDTDMIRGKRWAGMEVNCGDTCYRFFVTDI